MKFEYSAGAFIYKMEKEQIMLLVLIKENKEYDLAKGHIEKGETSEQAARREIKEESGLEPYFLPFFSIRNTYFFKAGRQRIHKEVRFFIAESDPSKKVKISEEHIGYKWLDYESAVKALKHRDLVKIMPRILEYIKRWEAMKVLNKEYDELPKKQTNWTLSPRHVPGEGRLDAKVMLLGQAPGRNEDIQLRPFIGRSGRLLTAMLKKNRIRREEAYITSVVQFFPPDNRMPSTEEIELCKPFLFRQIAIIKPRYVITLGNLASESMLEIGEVEKNHGKVVEKDGVTYVIMFHPAAALRSTGTLKLMEEDFRKLGLMLKES